MARPGRSSTRANPRPALLKLAKTYAQLLLHGDTVDVVEDKKVTIGGRTGHTYAVRAGYRDVVNQPAFLRITVLTAPEGAQRRAAGPRAPRRPGLAARDRHDHGGCAIALTRHDGEDLAASARLVGRSDYSEAT